MDETGDGSTHADGVTPSADLAAARANLRVLLAEDHPINRKMVEVILEMIGIDLTSVETGQDALEAFSVSAFDLVLMDLQMPVMDGLTAIRGMRALERDRGAPPTPIYALTASALPEQIAASRLAGADAHLVKPVAAAHLMAAVRAVGQPGALEATRPPPAQRRA